MVRGQSGMKVCRAMLQHDTVPSHDTTIHVAQFLHETVGATRERAISIAWLPLDGELGAMNVAGDLRLTRIPTGILVRGNVTGKVAIECIRCLEVYDQPVEAAISDEYRPTVDIVSGAELALDTTADEAEHFLISSGHVLDLSESLRQSILLAMPMAPHCRADCPGLTAELEPDTLAADDRLAILGQLLADKQDEPSAQPAANRRATGD